MWSSATDSDAPETYWSIPLGSDSVTPISLLVNPDYGYKKPTVDGTKLYVWESGAGGIHAVPLTGGTLTMIGSSMYLSYMHAHGGYLYYSARATSVFAGDGVVRIPAAGGAEEGLVMTINEIIERFTVSDDSIFLVGELSFDRYDFTDLATPRYIYTHPFDVGTIGQMVDQLFVDADKVFFSDSHNNIGWVKNDGSDCGMLVEDFVVRDATYNVDLALDADYLYIVEVSTSSIYRLSRTALGF